MSEKDAADRVRMESHWTAFIVNVEEATAQETTAKRDAAQKVCLYVGQVLRERGCPVEQADEISLFVDWFGEKYRLSLEKVE